MAVLNQEKKLESPVGEAFSITTPALKTPRPALEILADLTQNPNLPRRLTAHLESGRQLARRHRRHVAELLPIADPALDALLEGGLARGELVELTGRRGAGRFSLLLQVLAAVTGVGEAAALIDLGDGLDPQDAYAAGVDLERLLWLRPRHVRETLAASEAAIHGGFPLVVVDLGPPPVAGGRGAGGAWLRLARAAREHETALLLSAPYRVSGPAAETVITAAGRAAWHGSGSAPRLLARLVSRLTLDKRRGRAPGAGHERALTHPAAIRPAAPPREAPTPARLRVVAPRAATG